MIIAHYREAETKQTRKKIFISLSCITTNLYISHIFKLIQYHTTRWLKGLGMLLLRL